MWQAGCCWRSSSSKEAGDGFPLSFPLFPWEQQQAGTACSEFHCLLLRHPLPDPVGRFGLSGVSDPSSVCALWQGEVKGHEPSPAGIPTAALSAIRRTPAGICKQFASMDAFLLFVATGVCVGSASRRSGAVPKDGEGRKGEFVPALLNSW